MSLYRKWIHNWEKRLTSRDRNRRIFPFEWGLDWLDLPGETSQGALEIYRDFSSAIMENSEEFFTPPETATFRLQGDALEFPTPTPTIYSCNNTAHCRIFPSSKTSNAVIVVPQWNADEYSHVGLCKILQRLGVTTVRLTLPYHEGRRPEGMERADFMVSPNIGRTLHATRQGVLEVRQVVQWLKRQGYGKIALMGTSIGSCVTYLAFAHDREIDSAVFNHVSAYFADVVWKGLSTRYVRWGLEGHIDLENLRDCWAPISPACYVNRLKDVPRPHLMITARYDLTFLPELSEKVFQLYRDFKIACEQATLPCGHYTTGSFPFKYLVGWYICSYLRRQLA